MLTVVLAVNVLLQRSVVLGALLVIEAYVVAIFLEKAFFVVAFLAEVFEEVAFLGDFRVDESDFLCDELAPSPIHQRKYFKACLHEKWSEWKSLLYL